MIKFILAFLLLTFTNMLLGQEIRKEIVNAATSFDQRANSDTVPDAYAINSHFDRILVVRLKHQSDLLSGMETMVRLENFRNAVILSAIGSVRNYRYHTVSNRTFPTRNVFVENPTGPADITSMNGYVIGGRLHAHVTFADSTGAFGGHLEMGTTVFTFAIVTFGILGENADLGRADDKTYR